MSNKTTESEAKWSVVDPREVIALEAERDLEPVLRQLEVVEEAVR